MVHELYVLQGEVPETVIPGETLYIRQFCDLGFYYWVMFRDEAIQYPD